MAVTPPILYVIADHTFAGGDDPWLRRVGEIADAVAARVASTPHIYLQLRAKDVGAADRPGLLGRALAAARRADFPVLVNGSLEEAVNLGFDGVHWPEDLIPDTAPERSGFLRSASVHSHTGLAHATRAGVDMVLFAPVYAPGSKTASGVGVRALADLVDGASVPVLALGGITPVTVRPCLQAGAAGVAVVSAVMSPEVSAATALAGLAEQLNTTAKRRASRRA